MRNIKFDGSKLELSKIVVDISIVDTTVSLITQGVTYLLLFSVHVSNRKENDRLMHYMQLVIHMHGKMQTTLLDMT